MLFFHNFVPYNKSLNNLLIRYNMYKVVLLRHGQSEWNKLNLFTGWQDVDLTEQGVQEAREAGRYSRGLTKHLITPWKLWVSYGYLPIRVGA